MHPAVMLCTTYPLAFIIGSAFFFSTDPDESVSMVIAIEGNVPQGEDPASDKYAYP